MDFIVILSIILIIIVVFIIIGFVVWYSRRKNPELPEDYYEEDYDMGYVEREFRCPNCGSQVDSDELICHECGSEFKEGEYECPKCGELVDPNELECPHCGEVFELEPNVCPNCGKVVAADAIKCPKCGEEFWSPLKLPEEEEMSPLPIELEGEEVPEEEPAETAESD
jgi:RNA polymerase subunit RPABC4/transcription elongation factor Spt4